MLVELIFVLWGSLMAFTPLITTPDQAKVVGFEWKHWYDMEEPRGPHWHIV